MTLLLAVDIGGTKSELAVFDLANPGYVPLAGRRYSSREYGGIEEIIDIFLQDTGLQPDYACLGIAGVVEPETAIVTNLPWGINARSLAGAFGFQGVVLLNDLTAVCASIALLGRDDLFELQRGEQVDGGMIAVIAPGTGLGEGMLLQTDTDFYPQGSEGGHADFAPVDEEQVALLSWMMRKGRPVNYEDLIAGPGIALLYDFLQETTDLPETEAIRLAMQEADDPTPIIVEGALGTTPCPLCLRTVDLFLAILGSEAGNLALKLYARGGLYVGGGIVPRLAGRVSFAGFIENFLRKGKMSALMATIPVRLILKKNAALLGVARYGRIAFDR